MKNVKMSDLTEMYQPKADKCHRWLVNDLQSTLSEIHSRVAGSDFRLICGHCSTSVAGQVGNFKEPPHRIVWYRGNSWFGTFKHDFAG